MAHPLQNPGQDDTLSVQINVLGTYFCVLNFGLNTSGVGALARRRGATAVTCIACNTPPAQPQPQPQSEADAAQRRRDSDLDARMRVNDRSLHCDHAPALLAAAALRLRGSAHAGSPIVIIMSLMIRLCHAGSVRRDL
eukprot:1590281-Rhodomonas_salina.2